MEEKIVNFEEEIQEKKENFFQKAGRKIKEVAKKVWPYALGGVVLTGLGLLYLAAKDDNGDVEDYSLLDSGDNDIPFAEGTGE